MIWFCFVFETGFHYVALFVLELSVDQVGFEFYLCLCNPMSAGI